MKQVQAKSNPGKVNTGSTASNAPPSLPVPVSITEERTEPIAAEETEENAPQLTTAVLLSPSATSTNNETLK